MANARTSRGLHHLEAVLGDRQQAPTASATRPAARGSTAAESHSWTTSSGCSSNGRTQGTKRVEQAIAYVDRNLYCLDYGALRTRGFSIGSGAMESMHRTGS